MPVPIGPRWRCPGGIDTDWGCRSGHPEGAACVPERSPAFLLVSGVGSATAITVAGFDGPLSPYTGFLAVLPSTPERNTC